MKCPRQTAFIKQLDELLIAYYDAFKDRFFVSESDEYIEKFAKKKKHFVNLWCPTLKEYEEV